jgi:uncharacterized DUF497 family protein
MRLVWDERKSRINRAKHKVGFETAELVFEDPLSLSIHDRIVEGEYRWQPWGWWVARSSCWLLTPMKRRAERRLFGLSLPAKRRLAKG